MHSQVNRERPAVQLSSVRNDASPRPDWKYTKEQTKKRKTFTSHAIAKKDSVLDLCNPFVLATHPPRIDQERLNHGRSDGRQICRIVSLDFRGVISRRLSKDVRRTFKFRILNFHSLGAERGFRKREKGRRAGKR